MDEESVWYVMDEVGTSVEHSDEPNVKLLPFLYMPSGKIDDLTISYSLLWPTKDLSSGEPLFRDYLPGITEEKHRSARLTVWFNVPFDPFTRAYKEYKQKLALKT
jgi:tubulin--tyrosine ligase-like protein 12